MRLYLEKRDHIKAFSRFPVLTIALLLAIFMSFLVLWSVGVNPFEAYLIVGEEIFLTDYGWQDLLVKITPLLLTGAAVALAAQMKLWNIGAEGQFHMGTFAVTWGALNFGHLNTFSLIPFLLILSIIGGGLWGCIPGVLKSRFGVNEIITSLLLILSTFCFSYSFFAFSPLSPLQRHNANLGVNGGTHASKPARDELRRRSRAGKELFPPLFRAAGPPLPVGAHGDPAERMVWCGCVA